MTIPDAIGLGITIGLGIVSIVLGVFAVWLSHRFAQQSSSAQSRLQELVTEMRALTERGLTHQDQFSAKMLDSILARDQYGTGSSELSGAGGSIEELLRARLRDAEGRISSDVEDRVRSLLDESAQGSEKFREAIASIHSKIQSLATDVSSSFRLPSQLRDTVLEWQKHPGMLTLTALIAEQEATSPEDIQESASKYHLPEGWEGGIKRLLDRGVLTGTQESFEIVEDTRLPLLSWLSLNRYVIEQLVSFYGQETDPDKQYSGGVQIVKKLRVR